jgi:uracil-DNA glycosylase
MAFYAQKRSVTPRIPPGAPIVFVGDVPTRADLEAGQAFAPDSAAYRLIAKGLKHNAIDPGSCGFTHSVLHGGVAYDKPALRAAAKARKTELMASLGDARWIVPMGPVALKTVLSLKKSPDFFKGWRGSVSAGTHNPASFILPILHPNLCFGTPKWMPWLNLDINRLGRLVRASGWAPPESNATITIGRTVDAIRAWLERHNSELHVASDVETVGLGPTRTDLVCYGLGVPGAALIIPWSKKSNGRDPWHSEKDENTIVTMVNTFFRTRYAVSHNGPAFDHIVLQRYGFVSPLWHDTLQISHAAMGHMPKNLAHVATTYLDVGPWKHVDHATKMDDLWFYNAQDVLYTIEAFHAMVGDGGAFGKAMITLEGIAA